jgi:hypothetical protein
VVGSVPLMNIGHKYISTGQFNSCFPSCHLTWLKFTFIIVPSLLFLHHVQFNCVHDILFAYHVQVSKAFVQDFCS